MTQTHLPRFRDLRARLTTTIKIVTFAALTPLLSACGGGEKYGDTILELGCQKNAIQLLGTPTLKVHERFNAGSAAKIRVDAVLADQNPQEVAISALDGLGISLVVDFVVKRGKEKTFQAPASHPNDYEVAVKLVETSPNPLDNPLWAKLEVRCCGCK